jgi:hypothetical protein
MASALQIVKALTLPVVASLQNRTPDLVLKQLYGLAPDPEAAANRDTSALSQFLTKTVAPIVASFIPGGSTALQAAQQLTASRPVIYTPQQTLSQIQSILPTTGGPMSFADGTSDGFDLSNVFGGISQVFQGGLGQSLLGLGTQAASQYITSSLGPVYSGVPGTSGPVAQPVMSSIPRIAGTGMVVARSLFARFPNLATAIQRLRNAGANVTRAKLWSLMKRFGPDFLISGGILTAAAASELAMAGPGRRRMNPGNIKALRKAHRRMKSFHHICATNDTLLHSRRRKTPTGRFAGTSITQVK